MSATRPRHAAARRATARSVVAVAFLVAVGGAGAASAYWSEAGSGVGAGGTTASTATVSLAPGTVSASLYPGGRGDVAAEARNPGAAEVVLRSLELDISQGDQGLAVDAGHTGCPAAAFTFAAQDNGGAGWVVPRRSGDSDGTVRLVLPGAIELATDAPDGCQGATVTVFLRTAS